MKNLGLGIVIRDKMPFEVCDFKVKPLNPPLGLIYYVKFSYKAEIPIVENTSKS